MSAWSASGYQRGWRSTPSVTSSGSRQPRQVLQRTRPKRTDEERGTPRRPPDARDRSERQRVRAMDGWSVPVGIRMSRAPTVKRRAGRHATSWSEPVVSPPVSSAQSVARTAGADGTMALVPRGTHLALLSVGQLPHGLSGRLHAGHRVHGLFGVGGHGLDGARHVLSGPEDGFEPSTCSLRVIA